MKKQLIYIGIVLIVSTLLLTSCNLFSLSYETYDYTESFSQVPIMDDNVEIAEPFNKHFYDVTRSNPTQGFRSLTLPSKGEQKLLVLPISFSDYDLDELDGNEGRNAYINLQNAFFGQPENTLWESVASFYYKSSYGQLSLTGEVAPWYQSDMYTVSSINAAIDSGLDKQTITSDLLREAVSNFTTHNPEKVADYDQDEDGYLDAVYLIYAYPFNHNSRDLGQKNIFWAFATFDDKNGHTGSGPFAHNYAWSSYYFTQSQQSFFNRQVDSHTFIHEVTHMFGVPDYYNVNLDDEDNPLGGFDMMDYTIGDHSGLTKLLLEWTRPLILKDEGEVTLRSFTQSGDVLLIPQQWQGHALDEYLMLEYYTPTHLNTFDSRLNHSYKLPNRPGLKVSHVDARTVYELRDGYVRNYVYSDEFDGDDSNLYEMLAHSNSTGRGNQGKIATYKLYQLLEKSGENTFKNGEKADENTLFYKGDSFGIDTFVNYTFHRGEYFPYTFEVMNMNQDSVTIHFTKK